MTKFKRGCVHIYTGEGKGKTTAALGLALRAVGCGCRVCFLQFFKDCRFPCGELDAVKRLGKNFKFKKFEITHPMSQRGGRGNASEIPKKLRGALKETGKIIKSRRFDLVILDEVLIGVSQGFFAESELLDIVADKPEGVELVLTGRGATEKLIKKADYVTYMRNVKHPFDAGLRCRQGIEF